MGKILSLFSGCGAYDLGLIRAGHQIVWANDNDHDALKTYIRNIKPAHPVVCADVFDAIEGDLPECDCLIGGFPCQSYSIANNRRSVSDPRSHLYKAIVRAVERTDVACFLCENVKGLESIDSGKEIERILCALEKSGKGYKVSYSVLDAKNCGVPQHRERIFIFGVRNDLQWNVASFPTAVNGKYKRTLRIDPLKISPISVKSAIGDLPSNFTDGILQHYGTLCKVKISNRIGNRAMSWDKPSPTIMGRGGKMGGPLIPPHPDGARRLSIRECARLQTFPDDFVFEGSNSSAYRQIGNAVPVNMAYHVGLWLKETEDANKIVGRSYRHIPMGSGE